MLRVITISIVTIYITIASADECILSQADFPSSACSFNDPLSNVNVKALEFGKIDAVSAGEIFLGSARYRFVAEEITILDAGNITACNFDASVLSDAEVGEDIVFTIDHEDPRKITRLWLLRCSSYKAR